VKKTRRKRTFIKMPKQIIETV